MIRDTRHERFYFNARHQNQKNYDTRHATREFKCKKMKILDATRDMSVYLIIEHTDTSVTFRDTRQKCLVYIRNDIFRDRRHEFFLNYGISKIKWKQAKLVENSKQTDNNNCGVFICYFFRNIIENGGFKLKKIRHKKI